MNYSDMHLNSVNESKEKNTNLLKNSPFLIKMFKQVTSGEQ